MVANVHGLYQKYCKLNNSKKVFGATSGSGENTELAGDSQTAPPPPSSKKRFRSGAEETPYFPL